MIITKLVSKYVQGINEQLLFKRQVQLFDRLGEAHKIYKGWPCMSEGFAVMYGSS